MNIWADRYLPNFASLSISTNPSMRDELRRAASHEGRTQMIAQFNPPLIEEKCHLAVIRTKDLYDHLPENLEFMEALRLSQFASRVYLKLFEVYQESATTTTSAPELTSTPELWDRYGGSSLAAWKIPKIDRLADTLEPLLLQFQEQHMIAKNWRMLGFITTQISLSNALLYEHLTSVEQVLIAPYFNFLEEQVALPWQRICAAAAGHHSDSPSFRLVEQMMPLASEISQTVFHRLHTSFPHHQSRRGHLDHPGVRHSCLRDLSMFQAYLWLCVLQGSLKVVEQELIALCVMVLECVGVSWEMTAQANELLMNEILHRLAPQEQDLIRPYTASMIRAFCQQDE
jgi:hypothetical protein